MEKEIGQEIEEQKEELSIHGGNIGLPFGLCKKYGIAIQDDWTPRDAWEALKKKTGLSPDEFYKQLNKNNAVKENELAKKFSQDDSAPQTMERPEDRASSINYGSSYKINESLAEQAHEMHHFSEYKKGRETNSYNSQISRFDQNVSEIIEQYKKDGELTDKDYEEVNRLADAYRKNLANYINETSANMAKYPSWFIAGPARYNTKKSDAIFARDRALFEENERKIDPDSNIYLDKIKRIMSSSVIKSNDSNAIGKLQAKYDRLKEQHENGIAMNKHWKKFGTMKGFNGISDEEAEKLDKEINNERNWSHVPVPSYHLTNENAELRRLEGRINSLKKAKETPAGTTQYPKVEGVDVVENGDAMRVQLKFPDKPDYETREVLKRNGFIYSPRFGTWQRQLTDNGKRGARRVLEELQKMGKSF